MIEHYQFVHIAPSPQSHVHIPYVFCPWHIKLYSIDTVRTIVDISQLTVQKPGPKAGSHRRSRPSSSRTLPDAPASLQHPIKKAKVDNSVIDLPKLPSIHNLTSGLPHSYAKNTTASSSSHSPRSSAKSNNPFLKFVLPNHAPTTEIHAPNLPRDSTEIGLKFSEACAGLGCSFEQGLLMIDVYFNHMTAYTLFHRPTFKQKLQAIVDVDRLQAFVSPLFAYALRFRDNFPLLHTVPSNATAMLDLSSKLQIKCIEECLDDDPPLYLLQSLFLVAFQKLIHGVRGKTWRLIGDCIRIAYELKLHLLDVGGSHDESEVNHEVDDGVDFVLHEEKRRIWWAIWEMDTFTCTLRKLPSAIDERLNFTYLPISDEDWYTSRESRSCFLYPDATRRWKALEASGNRSAQAWYIVINSYMFDAFQMGAFPEVWCNRIGFSRNNSSEAKLLPQMRSYVENCLQCAHGTLPKELEWQDRFLAFEDSVSEHGLPARSIDCARYCIHVMAQLARLMLCIWEINHAPENARVKSSASDMGSHRATDSTQDQTWDKYVDAANFTATMIRNCSPQHHKFVNPLIVNAIWFAAASLVVSKLFGPADFDSRLAQSNFDLLVVTLNQYEAFWQIPKVLKDKLRNLEDTLKHLQPKTLPVVATPVEQSGTMPTQIQFREAPQHHSMLEASLIQPDQLPFPKHEPYIDLQNQDWLIQGYLDFNSIPSFGSSQTGLITPFPFDTTFEPNLDIDGFNFHDLFAYPY